MPFKSKAQFRKFLELRDEGKLSKEEFQKWVKETGGWDDIRQLPERIGKKTKKKRS